MKKNPLIKVGMLVSYDWHLIKKSLPLIYNEADRLVLAIDKNRRTWSGLPFELPDSFFEWIRTFDVIKKIEFYEDDFFIPHLSPIENDTRERNLLAEFLGSGGWHVQVDADEYFINFPGFVNYLKNINPDKVKPINITCGWIMLLKKLDNGYIYVAHNNKKYITTPVATNNPAYQHARVSGNFNHFSGHFMVHETWARSEDELLNKINNWGHRDDFNKESYYTIWKALDQNNYQYIKNFHPIQPEIWPSLDYCEGEDITTLIANIKQKNNLKIKFKTLLFKNSRNLARLRVLANKFY